MVNLRSHQLFRSSLEERRFVSSPSSLVSPSIFEERRSTSRRSLCPLRIRHSSPFRDQVWTNITTINSYGRHVPERFLTWKAFEKRWKKVWATEWRRRHFSPPWNRKVIIVRHTEGFRIRRAASKPLLLPSHQQNKPFSSSFFFFFSASSFLLAFDLPTSIRPPTTYTSTSIRPPRTYFNLPSRTLFRHQLRQHAVHYFFSSISSLRPTSLSRRWSSTSREASSKRTCRK